MLDLLSHIFLPHHTNNHRAKFLHHITLVIIICLVLVSSFFVAYSEYHYREVLGVSSNITVTELLELTNQKRQEQGLEPLVLNEKLNAAASGKANDMFAKNYWAHNSPDGATPWVFVRSSGYDYLYAGENLARGFTTTPEIVNAWMESPGHRENILSGNYSDVGFAILDGNLTGDETVLVVQMFGKPKTIAPEVAEAQDFQTATQDESVVQFLPQDEPIVAPDQRPVVASVQSTPLVDTEIFSKTSSSLLLGMLLGLLVLDAVIVKRKKIVRLLSHNLDHVMFLFVVLVVILIIGNGVVL